MIDLTDGEYVAVKFLPRGHKVRYNFVFVLRAVHICLVELLMSSTQRAKKMMHAKCLNLLASVSLLR